MKRILLLTLVLAGAGSPSAADPDAARSTAPVEGGAMPSEVVIRGSDAGRKISTLKPPLQIETDVFESIRASFEPDEALLLAESPFTVTWRRTHPETLVDGRVVEPWRTTFSERAGIVFKVRERLSEALQRPIERKEAKGYGWSFTIADEEGRVFQNYEGSREPPEELVWTGQNDQGEWIRPGRSYSAVYLFTDPGGASITKVGKPVSFRGIAHQESDGMYLSLDAAALFGPSKALRELAAGGEDLLRSAADLIKRRYNGVPLKVLSVGSSKDLADAQAGLAREFLVKELMLMPQHAAAEGAAGSYSEQRVEIILLNR